MSHITSIEIQVSDLTAFEKACREVGVELRREQKTFKSFGGNRVACDMAVAIPGNRDAYEAGLVRNADGKYTVQVDNWSGGQGLNEKIGHNAGKLLQRYGINAATSQALKQGMSVREEVLANGQVRLVCTEKPKFATQFAGKF